MASKKKQSEGITLLSMYNDNNDDDMEDAEEEEDVNRGKEQVDVAEQTAEEDLAPNRLFSPVQEQQRVELKISKSAILPIFSVWWMIQLFDGVFA